MQFFGAQAQQDSVQKESFQNCHDCSKPVTDQEG